MRRDFQKKIMPGNLADTCLLLWTMLLKLARGGASLWWNWEDPIFLCTKEDLTGKDLVSLENLGQTFPFHFPTSFFPLPLHCIQVPACFAMTPGHFQSHICQTYRRCCFTSRGQIKEEREETFASKTSQVEVLELHCYCKEVITESLLLQSIYDMVRK